MGRPLISPLTSLGVVLLLDKDRLRVAGALGCPTPSRIWRCRAPAASLGDPSPAPAARPPRWPMEPVIPLLLWASLPPPLITVLSGNLSAFLSTFLMGATHRADPALPQRKEDSGEMESPKVWLPVRLFRVHVIYNLGVPRLSLPAPQCPLL